MNNKLFIDNLAPNTTRETLEQLFQTTGKVQSVSFPERPDANSSHAFVVMENPDDVKKAIMALNNKNWNGYRITVTRADKVQASHGFSGHFRAQTY
jgi:RNA recognition motif-containing protein